MLRQIIKIDQDKCNGCGLCVSACHEGAIGMNADNKAVLLRDDYCDGLGACLPVCPTDAIRFEEREALAFDEEAVRLNTERQKSAPPQTDTLPCGCPGTNARTLDTAKAPSGAGTPVSQPSQLRQWPVQIKLVSVNAPYLNNADLLIAADCTAYAYGNFHSDFMKDRITLIGCPKLDEGQYSEKLTALFTANTIQSVTVARMEVPCCGGLETAVRTALRNSGKTIPCHIVTISTDGNLLA